MKLIGFSNRNSKKKVPYIFTSGDGQAIESLLAGSTSFEHVVFDCKLQLKTDGYSYLMGHIGSSYWCCIELSNNGSLGIHAGNNAWNCSYKFSSKLNQRVVIEAKWKNQKTQLSIDGTVVAENSFSGNLPSGNIRLLNSRDTPMKDYTTPIGKFYSIQIYAQDGSLRMDLVPRCDSQNIGYMHDNVSGNDFYSSGPNQFGYGEE